MCVHVQADDPTVISFLLRTEIIPLCLQIMESGARLSKTVRCSACLIISPKTLDRAAPPKSFH